MLKTPLKNALRSLRTRSGLRQQELAARVGVSRQAVIAIEQGKAEPSTGVSLRLARELGCTVEQLFQISERERPLEVDFAGVAAAGSGRRVALAKVGARWVAHALPADQPSSLLTAADGLLLGKPHGGRARVSPLRDPETLRDALVAVGCDPALGLVSARLSERGARLTWLHAPSEAALETLARGHAHLAGLHLLDEESGLFNAPFVRQRFPGRSMAVVGLARWEQGFVVRKGNPLSIRSAGDLVRARLINREPGSGARVLLDRLLRKAGVRPALVAGYDSSAHGHLAVAQAVTLGAADVGIATRGAAQAHGLRFLPLSEERFDLVLPGEALDEASIGRLIETLRSRSFRRELGALIGYGVARSGDVEMLS